MHKRILENGKISKRESEICETLTEIKKETDEKIMINNELLNNESYFENMSIKIIIEEFDKTKIELDPDAARFINHCLVKEYMNEYQGAQRW